jgi:hypothetical protein
MRWQQPPQECLQGCFLAQLPNQEHSPGLEHRLLLRIHADSKFKACTHLVHRLLLLCWWHHARPLLLSHLHLAASLQCSAVRAAAAVLLVLRLVLGMCLVGAAAGCC